MERARGSQLVTSGPRRPRGGGVLDLIVPNLRGVPSCFESTRIGVLDLAAYLLTGFSGSDFLPLTYNTH